MKTSSFIALPTLEGVWTMWHDNGQKMGEGTCKNGQKLGQVIFKNGVPIK